MRRPPHQALIIEESMTSKSCLKDHDNDVKEKLTISKVSETLLELIMSTR